MKSRAELGAQYPWCFAACCPTSSGYRPDVFKTVSNHFIGPIYYLINKILSYTSLDKNFITAWKSITKLVIFRSFFAKCCKMRVIQLCEICRFSVTLYYTNGKLIPFFIKRYINFPCVIQNDWKTTNFAGIYYYSHFTTFHNETSEYY
jgi:hypothetical protein